MMMLAFEYSNPNEYRHVCKDSARLRVWTPPQASLLNCCSCNSVVRAWVLWYHCTKYFFRRFFLCCFWGGSCFSFRCRTACAHWHDATQLPSKKFRHIVQTFLAHMPKHHMRFINIDNHIIIFILTILMIPFVLSLVRFLCLNFCPIIFIVFIDRLLCSVLL